ncbi:MAG TPA: hypothetical protein VJ866_08995 [Pyrinomonadaceae bacterium]|nr:hypothetical protein [Pyrinomonadaceae bacterium]
MPAFVVTVLIWVGTKAAESAASAVASKLISIPVDKVLSIEVEGATVGARFEAFALGMFTGNIRPDPTYEQKVAASFKTLQDQVSKLEKGLAEVKEDLANFKWQVKEMFDEADERSLWKDMLDIDSALDTAYENLSELVAANLKVDEQTKQPVLTPEQRRKDTIDHANGILKARENDVKNTRRRMLGEAVTSQTRVKGFIEIWQQQALRDADLGWNANRLIEVYEMLEAKFTRALLIQLKSVRLQMEAHEALHRADPSKKGAVDFFVDKYYPTLREEVDAFRNMVETLAVNLIPLPTGQMLPLVIPDQIAGMLARLDMYTAQALGGKIKEPAGAGGPAVTVVDRRQLDVPALAGCWGRVVIPGTRWIKRAPGSKEKARVKITGPGGKADTLSGTLEVRAARYLPYESKKGETLHKGYQLQVGNEPLDMDKMLMAHFTPSDVLSIGTTKEGEELDVQLETEGGELLAKTKAFLVTVPLDAEGKQTTPYGTFIMSFKAGAGLRGIG